MSETTIPAACTALPGGPPSMCCHRDDPPLALAQVRTGIQDVIDQVEDLHAGTGVLFSLNEYDRTVGHAPAFISFAITALDDRIKAVHEMLLRLDGREWERAR